MAIVYWPWVYYWKERDVISSVLNFEPRILILPLYIFSGISSLFENRNYYFEKS